MKIFKQIERNGRRIIKKILVYLLTPPPVQDKFNKLKNIIIIRIDERLGNLVLLNAVVKSFIMNNIQTSLVACKKYAGIYQYNKNIKKIIYFNKKSLFNPINIIKLIAELRKQTYDLLFDATNPEDLSTLTFFIILLIKARIKYGFDGKERHLILNKIIPAPDRPGHILEYYAVLFKNLNLKYSKNIIFNLPDSLIRKNNHLTKKDKKIIIVHPGGRDSKQWDIKKLLIFLDTIKNNKIKFLILLGPAEYNMGNFFLSRGYDVIKPGNINELVKILSTGKIYIGNDSGPMHLAAALGLAIFAIYKPLASIMFGPAAYKYQIVVSDHPQALSVQEVYKKYRSFSRNLI